MKDGREFNSTEEQAGRIHIRRSVSADQPKAPWVDSGILSVEANSQAKLAGGCSVQQQLLSF